MTDRDKDVIRQIVREEFQVMIDLSVSQQLAKLKDELKRELAHDLSTQVRLHGGRRMETK